MYATTLKINISSIFTKTLNYLWFFIKLIFFSAIFAIPFVFIVDWLKKPFLKFREKKSFIVSLFLLTYIVLAILLLIYFIVLLFITSIPVSGFYLIIFFIYNILKLLFINLLLSAIVVIFAMITTFAYEKINSKHKQKDKKKSSKKSLNYLDLWLSLTITFICVFFVYLIFPKILALLLYLILI